MLIRSVRVRPLSFDLMFVLLCMGCWACNSSKDAAVPSGAVCPEGSTVTYEAFVAPFMTRYCNDCHSSKVAGADREGAPSDHNFDTLAGVLEDATHVDEQAAFGPDSENEAMPPSGEKPTRAEREKLGEWIACQIKAGNVSEHEHDDDHDADTEESVDHDHDGGAEHDHDAGATPAP